MTQFLRVYITVQRFNLSFYNGIIFGSNLRISMSEARCKSVELVTAIRCLQDAFIIQCTETVAELFWHFDYPGTDFFGVDIIFDIRYSSTLK